MRSDIEIVVVGASCGGIEVLEQIFASLPGYFPVPLVVVQHIAVSNSRLPALLQRVARQHVDWAKHGEVLRPNTVRVAPGGLHTTLSYAGATELRDWPKHNFVRPSVDHLFMSAARVYKSRALAVILTGKLQDGAAGAEKIRSRGGIVVVQAPETCKAAGMPNAVLKTGAASLTVSPEIMAHTLTRLVMGVEAHEVAGSTAG